MSEILPKVGLSTDLAVASHSVKSKAQRDFLSEAKEDKHAAAHSILLSAISSTLENLMKNHSARLKVQNKLFEERMKMIKS